DDDEQLGLFVVAQPHPAHPDLDLRRPFEPGFCRRGGGLPALLARPDRLDRRQQLVDGQAKRLELLLLEPEEGRFVVVLHDQAEAPRSWHADGVRFEPLNHVEVVGLTGHCIVLLDLAGTRVAATRTNSNARRGIWQLRATSGPPAGPPALQSDPPAPRGGPAPSGPPPRAPC